MQFDRMPFRCATQGATVMSKNEAGLVYVRKRGPECCQLPSLVDIFADLLADDLVDLPAAVVRQEAGSGGGHRRVRPFPPAPCTCIH